MNEQEKIKGRKKLQEAVYKVENLRARLAALTEHLKMVGELLKDNLLAKETLSGYKELSTGEELLIPIGGSSFITAKVKDTDKALVNIGGDTVIEDIIPNAIKKLERKTVELTNAQRKVAEEIRKVRERLSELSREVELQYKQVRDVGEFA